MKNGFNLPAEDCFDVSIGLNLTRKQTSEVKELLKDRNHYKYISHSSPFDYLPQYSHKADPHVFYTLKFRIVRFKISSNNYETVIAKCLIPIRPNRKRNRFVLGEVLQRFFYRVA